MGQRVVPSPVGPCSFCSSLSGPWDSGPFCLTPEVQFSLPLSLWPRLQVTGFPSWQSWDKVGQGGLRLCPWEAGLPGAAPGDRWTRCTSLPTAEPDPARRGPCALLGIRKRREKNLPCHLTVSKYKGILGQSNYGAPWVG